MNSKISNVLALTLAFSLTSTLILTPAMANPASGSPTSVPIKADDVAEVIVKGALVYITSPVWIVAGHVAAYAAVMTAPITVPAYIIGQVGSRAHRFKAYPMARERLNTFMVSGAKLTPQSFPQLGTESGKVNYTVLNQQLELVRAVFNRTSDATFIDNFWDWEYPRIARKKLWQHREKYVAEEYQANFDEIRRVVPELRSVSEAEICVIMDMAKNILDAEVDKMVRSWSETSRSGHHEIGGS